MTEEPERESKESFLDNLTWWPVEGAVIGIGLGVYSLVKGVEFFKEVKDAISKDPLHPLEYLKSHSEIPSYQNKIA